jgi:hypothetical protein
MTDQDAASDDTDVDPAGEDDGAGADDVRDSLPHDLDAGAFEGAYRFPDNSRRRVPGYIYVAFAAACLVTYLVAESSPLVNGGFLGAFIILTAVGLFSLSSGWRMKVDEREALIEAQKAIGFPVGHASAQQVWHGFRSRPTWRVLCYSAEDPPTRRGLVLVDAVDGHVIQHMVEDNPERWASRID